MAILANLFYGPILEGNEQSWDYLRQQIKKAASQIKGRGKILFLDGLTLVRLGIFSKHELYLGYEPALQVFWVQDNHPLVFDLDLLSKNEQRALTDAIAKIISKGSELANPAKREEEGIGQRVMTFLGRNKDGKFIVKEKIPLETQTDRFKIRRSIRAVSTQDSLIETPNLVENEFKESASIE